MCVYKSICTTVVHTYLCKKMCVYIYMGVSILNISIDTSYRHPVYTYVISKRYGCRYTCILSNVPQSSPFL
jgi:hypothetical protein